MNIDYNKLKRLFKDGEWQILDQYVNLDLNLISQIDQEMINSGFVKIDNNKYSSLLNDRERKLFLTVKIMAMYHIRFLTNSVQKLLCDDADKKKIEILQKECDTLKKVIDTKQKEIERLNG